ncbi:hypothetical protein J2129_000810 [Methanofollis sp. W23]|nr:hypothetical protein [Methanofollis sp. W23]
MGYLIRHPNLSVYSIEYMRLMISLPRKSWDN